MPELEAYGIDRATLQRMYDEWSEGAKKSALERKYLHKPESHGKLFTVLVREHLGVETERHSNQTARVREMEAEVTRLKRLLQAHGIDPASRTGNKAGSSS